jgi:hypothetical protein
MRPKAVAGTAQAGEVSALRRIDEPIGLPYKAALIARRRPKLSVRSMNRPKIERVPESQPSEAHLSAKQIGAQAPARFPRPYGDERRT